MCQNLNSHVEPSVVPIYPAATNVGSLATNAKQKTAKTYLIMGPAQVYVDVHTQRAAIHAKASATETNHASYVNSHAPLNVSTPDARRNVMSLVLHVWSHVMLDISTRKNARCPALCPVISCPVLVAATNYLVVDTDAHLFVESFAPKRDSVKFAPRRLSNQRQSTIS